MSFWLLPYRNGSESCRLLKNSLGINSIKLNGSLWKPYDHRWVINWGNTTHPLCEREDEVNFINPPSKVEIAVNKFLTFKTLSDDVLMPYWTQNKEAVRDWLGHGKEVVARKVLNGYGGQGIQLLTEKDMDNIPDAPLYTMYVPKKSEFRVHFIEGRGIVKLQRKARVLDVPEKFINWKIRNLGNGFIYALVEDMEDEHYYGLQSMVNIIHAKLGLSFFCADVIYNKLQDSFYLLEVNTAPGLNENTVETYREGFSHLFKNKNILKRIKKRNRGEGEAFKAREWKVERMVKEDKPLKVIDGIGEKILDVEDIGYFMKQYFDFNRDNDADEVDKGNF